MKKLQMMNTLRIPERFRGYRVAVVNMPGRPECDVIYDMETRTIWINSAAGQNANVAYVEFQKR